MIKKITVIGISSLLAVSCTACGGQKISYSDTVESVEWTYMITGETSKNHTEEVAVGGCDLGFPIYNSKNDTMYLAFGDTFINASKQEGLWRSNVLAYTTDYDLSDGLTFDGWKTNGNVASAIIEGYHVDYFEMTKIPTGGIEVNGVMYMFYFSKYSWQNAPEKSMNYGGAVKSVDNGQTWERVNDLSWLDTSMPERREEIEKLANEDINLQPTDSGITMDTHAGYSFTQVFPIDGKDGYVYILGEGGYRTGGIKLGRVAYANIEKFVEYEYYNGTDAEGNPIWLKGIEGLKTVDNNPDAVIIDDLCSEQSVVYNPYLQKWMIVYLQRRPGKIVYCTADNIYGPYSEPEVLITFDYPFDNGTGNIYAGCVHEKWLEENGKIFYMVISQWKPVYNSSLVKITLK